MFVEAGDDVVITVFNASIPFGEGRTRDAAINDAVEMTLEVGPLARADQPDDIRARASTAVRAVFAGCAGERSVMINGAVWIVTARNPLSNKMHLRSDPLKKNSIQYTNGIN